MQLKSDVNLTIALVGPTNVGKSSLFNKLTQSRRAIVCDRPGVTVDRQEFVFEGSPMGAVRIIDTGGVGPEALRHPLGAEIERAAQAAVKESDVILFVVDGTREVGLEEFEVSNWLRRSAKILDNKRIWVVANKVDSKKFDASSYYMLGFEKVISLSAEHGEGLLELWDELMALRPSSGMIEKSTEKKEKPPGILVLGRPNVGKSTLLNSILGQDRHVVSELPGTTRDTIESTFEHQGSFWRLCDTAGMRRPGRVERDVEWVAREKLKDAARQADLALLIVDSSEGVTEMDAAIAGMAIDFGLSLIVVFNKWDKMRGDEAEELLAKLERSSDLKLDFLKWCPKVRLSGLTGKGVGEVLKMVHTVLEARKYRVQTSKLNEIFERKLRLHSHPIGPRGKAAKFYYLSQVQSDPPEFVLFSNLTGKSVHFSYKRFITNTLRNEFGFTGTPIQLHFKVTRT